MLYKKLSELTFFSKILKNIEKKSEAECCFDSTANLYSENQSIAVLLMI